MEIVKVLNSGHILRQNMYNWLMDWKWDERERRTKDDARLPPKL